MPVIPREKWDRVEQYVEYLRHRAAYELLAKPFVVNRNILEIGCGSGYGAHYLSHFTKTIICVDISEESISYCRDTYHDNHIAFMIADGLNLPFVDEFFDVVLSFQVIEHINPKLVVGFLTEIKRVLKKEGIFIVSTPNARLRLLPFQKPWNPEHKKEYRDNEFVRLLSNVFSEVRLYGLCASPNVHSIEANRVRQDPVVVYLLRPASWALHHILPSYFHERVAKFWQRVSRCGKTIETPNSDVITNQCSLSDFTVNTSCPDDCLDLYGLCAKETFEVH